MTLVTLIFIHQGAKFACLRWTVLWSFQAHITLMYTSWSPDKCWHHECSTNRQPISSSTPVGDYTAVI